MTKEEAQRSIAEADALMAIQKHEGWKVVQRVLNGMREEAFSMWATAGSDVKNEDLLAARAQGRVMIRFEQELSGVLDKGSESRDNLAALLEAEESEAAFRARRAFESEEAEALAAPRRSVMDAVFGALGIASKNGKGV